MNYECVPKYIYYIRGVAKGGGADQLNPIQTRGADYAPHTTSSPPWIKKTIYLVTSLYIQK